MGAGKSSSIKNTDQALTVVDDAFERRCYNIHMVRNALLICLDGNNTDEKNKNWQKTLAELQRTVNNIITFSDSDQCLEFINTINDNQICIITSGLLGEQFVARVHDMFQVDSILIFSDNQQNDEQWSKAWCKIKGVFTDITSICDAVKQTAHSCEQNAMPLSFVGANKNFDQLDLSFIYTQILKEIILTGNFEEKHFKEFVDYCRELFADNAKELIYVKELENKYRTETPIWWYTYDCFLAPMLTRALRMINADIIIHMGFFLADLHRQIEQLHREQHADKTSSSTILTVYYAQGISKTDFEQLKKSQRGLMSFNNFLLTSKNCKLSLSFAQDIASKGDLIGIMFIMKIDPSQSSTPFASISNVSHSHTEDEILFSMHTIFRITDIKRLTANNRVQQVYLTLISDNDKDLTTLRNNIRLQTFADKQGWDRLGALLIKLHHFDHAEQVYQILLSQTKEMNEKANIFNQLGSIKDKQEHYFEAIPFYEQSLGIYQEIPPSNQLDLANIYFCIGIAYYKTGHYSEALSSHQAALKIREQLLPSDHPDLSKSYENLSLVYGDMDNYSAALEYLEKDLAIREKASPSNHPQLIKSCMNIGTICFNGRDYPKALGYYEKVLEIQLKSLPANHRDLAKTYNNMGAAYNSLCDYQKGLIYHEKALTIRQKTLSSNHPDFGTSYNNIGVTHENLGDFTKACSFFERAVEVGERSLPADHPVLQVRRENLARAKEKL